MGVVIHVDSFEELHSKLAAVLGNAINNCGSLQQASVKMVKQLSQKTFENALVTAAGMAGQYGKMLLDTGRLAESNKSQDVSQHMMPQHDADWRALDNLAYDCFDHFYSTLGEYHSLIHKHIQLAAETGECDTDALPRDFRLTLMEKQSQHLAYAFILQSHLELCSQFGRSGSALLHLDRIKSQVEERAAYRVRVFKQSLESKKNAQKKGRGNKTNKTKSDARKVDRSNVSDKGKNQRRRKGYKGVEAEENQTRIARTAQVRKR